VSLEIRQIKTRKEVRDFIYLPSAIHHSHTNWVPPIYTDEWRYFNPKKNRAFSYCNTVQLIAFRNGEAVGRILGIINHRSNEYWQEKNARFSHFECWNDQEVAHHLLTYIEKWARINKMNKIIGPYGFSNQDPQGFLIEGFEHPPTITTNCNFEYMIQLLENEGYSKEVDYVVYKVDIPKKIPETYEKIYQRVIRRELYEIVEFSKRRKLRPYIIPVLRLLNECFKDIYGFVPLDEQEMNQLARRYIRILDPGFIKLITINKKVVAFNIAMPNLSDGIRKSKGRLLPFGIFKILKAAKKTKQLDSLVGGIKEEYRGRGLDVLIAMKSIESAKKAGFKYVDSHHELETNLKVRAEMEWLGGKVYKRLRVFQKKLT
jgi:hypothetical protein